jgi:hypothetical protein
MMRLDQVNAQRARNAATVVLGLATVVGAQRGVFAGSYPGPTGYATESSCESGEGEEELNVEQWCQFVCETHFEPNPVGVCFEDPISHTYFRMCYCDTGS